MTSNYYTETMQTTRMCSEIFKVLREKNYQTRILCLVKLSFKSENEVKTFSDKQKWRFVDSRSALQKVLKEVFREKKSNID